MPASITLKVGREKSLKRRHPWVFAGAIEKQSGRLGYGDTVDVYSSKGEWLARAAFSPESQIRARIWTFDRNENIDNGFFIRRIESALSVRKYIKELAHTNAYRLIAGESDGLPGITIDLYANILVIQLLSAGAEKHRDKIIWALEKQFPEYKIYERSDVSVREKEGLKPIDGAIKGNEFEPVIINEGDVKLYVDVTNGHKTGFYLDQRDSRHLASTYMQGADVLNCFSYTGAFSIHALKMGAKKVTNVDASQQALNLSRQNCELNDCDMHRIEHVQADVFNYLRSCHESGDKFDHIILDPPKFVESKASLQRAARGYKDINLNALRCISKGGYLSTFSCSGLMSAELFQKIVADAALDADRNLRIIHRYHQAPDHAVSSTFPEGFYLKGLLCVVT